jgi:nitrogen fixation protein FixH
LRHPADENQDHPLRFREVAPGRYEAQVTNVRDGVWDVLVFNNDAMPFRANRRLWLR